MTARCGFHFLPDSFRCDPEKPTSGLRSVSLQVGRGRPCRPVQGLREGLMRAEGLQQNLSWQREAALYDAVAGVSDQDCLSGATFTGLPGPLVRPQLLLPVQNSPRPGSGHCPGRRGSKARSFSWPSAPSDRCARPFRPLHRARPRVPGRNRSAGRFAIWRRRRRPGW